MSSLQCPATLLLVGAPAPSPGVRAQAPEELLERLRSRRVASVWSSPAAYAREAAAVVATTTGGAVVVRTELAPVGDGERDDDVAHRLREVLQEAADLHRGEAVVLVTHARPLEVGLPRLARMGVRPRPLEAWGLVELEVDEEWWCRAWGAAPPEDADGAPTP